MYLYSKIHTMNQFSCKCCGDCCSGEMDIKLNIYDLYKMAKHLHLKNTKELFLQGYVKFEKGQNELFIPTMVFKKSPYPFCPFLINDVDEEFNVRGFCSLHPYIKPLVCILSPYSKVYDCDTGEYSYSVVKPSDHCPGKFEKMQLTPEEYLEPVQQEIVWEHRYFDLLHHIKEKNTANYNQRLYYFNIDRPFEEILEDITKDVTLKS